MTTFVFTFVLLAKVAHPPVFDNRGAAGSILNDSSSLQRGIGLTLLKT